MKFTKGNKAAVANPDRKALAKLVERRLLKEGAAAPIAQVTALLEEYNKLTGKRRRRSVKPKAKAKIIQKDERFNYQAKPTPEAHIALRVMLQEENREPTPEERNFDIRCMEAARRAVGENRVPRQADGSAVLADDPARLHDTRHFD